MAHCSLDVVRLAMRLNSVYHYCVANVCSQEIPNGTHSNHA